MMISNDWLPAMQEEFRKPYYRKLYETVRREYETRTIYPGADNIFNAFHYTPLSRVRVVILGQDPYHEPGQAHGLSFSVLPGVPVPPSLQNIYKELQEDLGCKIPNNGYLKSWADQGVFLLNTVLTVRAHQANSHQGIGWEEFTDHAIRELDKKDQPMVFLLFGSSAQKKIPMIQNQNHFVLKTTHPSPLSAHRGFLGSRVFSRCNAFLRSRGEAEIDWQINDITL